MIEIGIAKLGKGRDRLWIKSSLWPGAKVVAHAVDGLQIDDGQAVVFGTTESGVPIVLGTIGGDGREDD